MKTNVDSVAPESKELTAKQKKEIQYRMEIENILNQSTDFFMETLR